jgi:hypothetical protein
MQLVHHFKCANEELGNISLDFRLNDCENNRNLLGMAFAILS